MYHTPIACRQSPSLHRLSFIPLQLHADSATWACWFVCLFVEIKPEKLYSTSCVGREVNPLGAVTHGQRHKPRACRRQRHISRTCQSIVSTLQVDGLARITGLTSAPKSDASSATKTAFPQALYDILVLDGGRVGRFSCRYRWRRELPANLAILNTHGYKHAHIHKSTKQN